MNETKKAGDGKKVLVIESGSMTARDINELIRLGYTVLKVTSIDKIRSVDGGEDQSLFGRIFGKS